MIGHFFEGPWHESFKQEYGMYTFRKVEKDAVNKMLAPLSMFYPTN